MPAAMSTPQFAPANYPSLLQGIEQDIGNTIGNWVNGLVQGFENEVVKPLFDILKSAYDTVANDFTALITNAAKTIQNVVSQVYNGLVEIVAEVRATISNILAGVGQGIRDLVSTIKTLVVTILDGIQTGFDAVHNYIDANIRAVITSLSEVISEVERMITSTFVPIFSEIETFLQQLPMDVAQVISNVTDAIETLPAEVAKWAEPVFKYLNPVEQWKIIQEGFDVILQGLVAVANDIVVPEVRHITADLGFATGQATDVEMGRIVDSAAAMATLGVITAPFPSLGFILGQFFSSISSAALRTSYRALEYSANVQDPNKIADIGTIITNLIRKNISVDVAAGMLAKEGYAADQLDLFLKSARRLLGAQDLATARFRGLLSSDASYVEEVAKLGYTADDADKILGIAAPLSGLSEAIELWRRGILPEGWHDPFDDIRKQGWSEDRIDAFKQTSYRLPSLFELQDMQARNVSDLETVNKYQLDAYIDDNFFNQARKVGYDKETAQGLYRMYWEYPALFIIKDMYTAGQISEADFRDILKFERYTPYFIDVMVNALAPKLTPADIKDLYKYQQITGDQISPQLQAIGIPADLADQYSQLWQASVKLATPLDQTGSQAAAGKIKDDTESLVITAYKDGVMDRTTAAAELERLNYSQEAITLYLAIADYELNQQRIKDSIAEIKADMAAGNIDLNTAIVRLQALNLSDTQFATYSDQLQKSATAKPKVPTLAEFGGWAKKKIITWAQFVSGLQLLGYNDIWIPFYMEQYGASVDDVNSVFNK